MKKIIQFPHRKTEHGTDNPSKSSLIKFNGEEYIRWHDGEHARKFLKNTGKYIDEHGKINETEIVFWCEWEAQSKIIKKYKNNKGRLPEFVQEPFWDTVERFQNTDPFVFGDNFFYAFCKQRLQKLRALHEGDIILFGSMMDKKFRLDTVFVIKQYINYNFDIRNSKFYKKALSSIISACPPYDEITLSSGACGTNQPNYDYRFYEAVNYEERNIFNGIYSFFPAKEYNKNAITGFERPVIDLSKIQNYSETPISDFECSNDDLPIIDHRLQARGGARVVCIRNQEKTIEIWEEIKKQVNNAGLYEGIYTVVPEQKNIPYEDALHKNFHKIPKEYEIPNFTFSTIRELHIKISFKTNHFGGLIGCQNNNFNPKEFQPIIYIDKTGYLRAKLWDGNVDKTLTSDEKVNDNLIHEVEYYANFITGDQFLKIDNNTKNKNSEISRNQTTNIWQLGIVYMRHYPIHYRGRKISSVCGWYPFNGEIFEAIVKINQQIHYTYSQK